MLIRLGHSPGPDDAFMFWGVSAGAVDTRGFEFEHVLRDIQTLNEWATEGRLEVTALSLHAYPFVQSRYAILPHGATMGSGSGPVVVAREPTSPDRLREVEVAVPGRMTTAFLLLRLYLGEAFRYREVAAGDVLEEVRSGRAEVGLLIQEDQLTYEGEGFELVVDLGEWWLLDTGLPLPLGINVARRDLGGDRLHELCEVLGESIAAGFEHPDDALRHALRIGRNLDERLAHRLVDMYVDERMQDYGDEGRDAVRELLERGERAGAFDPVRVDFLS